MDKEILHIIIDSLPQSSAQWFEVFSALLTPAIALIAVYIAYQQHKINQERLRHETYDKRLKVYKAVQKHLSIIMQKGTTTYDACSEFYSEASEAAFLFDKSVMDRIDTIYTKSINLVDIHEQLYPSDGSTGIQGEKRGEVASNNTKLINWHCDELGKSKDFFAEKLGLKTT